MEPKAHDFESALRRDLSGAPVVAYETCVGGASKRALDLVLTIFLMPVWLLILGGGVATAAARGARPLFRSRQCVGYGGRSIQCITLNLEPPKQDDAADIAVVDIAMAARVLGARSGLYRVAERVPLLWAVLRGDMSLVGPTPVTRAELQQVRSARRAYLSMRPGLIGLGEGVEGDWSSLCKAYLISWTLVLDVSAILGALLGVRDRSRLWRPPLR